MNTAPPVLVLGHTGLVGRVLCSHLRGAGRSVIAASRQECDLLSEQSAARFFDALPGQYQVVMTAVVNRRVDDSRDGMCRNITMMDRLCRLLAAHEPDSLVLLSSVDVYGEAPSLPIDESTPPRPASYYGLGKLTSEHVPAIHNRGRFPVSILRLPGIYGTSADEPSIVAAFSRALRAGTPVTLRGDGTTRRDYVHVDDVCRVITGLLEAPYEGTVNVATGRSPSLRDIVEVLASVLRTTAVLHFAPAVAAGAGDLVFDTRRLHAVLPDMTLMDLRAGATAFAAHAWGPGTGRLEPAEVKE